MEIAYEYVDSNGNEIVAISNFEDAIVEIDPYNIATKNKYYVFIEDILEHLNGVLKGDFTTFKPRKEFIEMVISYDKTQGLPDDLKCFVDFKKKRE